MLNKEKERREKRTKERKKMGNKVGETEQRRIKKGKAVGKNKR